MPILIEVSEDAPLNQGDILKGVSLFETDSDWAQGGGEARRMKSPVCMVLSRPCAVLHKPQMVVASIECVKGETPRGVDTLAKVKQFLEQLRDGFNSPDRFYLGQGIPTLADQGRFFARLDSLHTIRLPDSDGLAVLLRSHRVATLADDFRRDLHRRMFSAFAALGFDDYGWYSDQDLAWLIAAARKDLAGLKSEITEKEEEMQRNISSGMEHHNQRIAARVEKLKRDVRGISDELTKYDEQHAKRRGGFS